jgi:hypothetical protein
MMKKWTGKANKMWVEPLGNFRGLFRASAMETVAAATRIQVTPTGYVWGSWGFTSSGELRRASETWALAEVVYVVAESKVLFVALVFRREWFRTRVVVRVAPETFEARLAGAANVAGVVVSTIASGKSGAKPEGEYPHLTLSYTRVVRGARANTAVAATTMHVVRDGTESTLYVPDGPSAVEYLGAIVDVSSAPRALVVGTTIGLDSGLELKDHMGLNNEEEELRDDGTCFVSTWGEFSGHQRTALCYKTGKITVFGSKTETSTSSDHTYEISEILYVADDAEGWGCVLACGRAAMRLELHSAHMLMSVMRLDVLTSTVIQEASVRLIPWPNAYGRDATGVVSHAIAPEHSGLMLDRVPRMIYVPSEGVIRYEPAPACTEEDAASRALWNLCAADAAAKAPSKVCALFRACPDSPVVSRLVHDGAVVDLRTAPSSFSYDYAHPDLLYGTTPHAVYVVRPSAARTEARVVVSRKESSELASATLEGGVWTVRVAEPACVSLVPCMQGASLEQCCGTGIAGATSASTASTTSTASATGTTAASATSTTAASATSTTSASVPRTIDWVLVACLLCMLLAAAMLQ